MVSFVIQFRAKNLVDFIQSRGTPFRLANGGINFTRVETMDFTFLFLFFFFTTQYIKLMRFFFFLFVFPDDIRTDKFAEFG